jgi:hypothetical protein
MTITKGIKILQSISSPETTNKGNNKKKFGDKGKYSTQLIYNKGIFLPKEDNSNKSES